MCVILLRVSGRLQRKTLLLWVDAMLTKKIRCLEIGMIIEWRLAITSYMKLWH